MCCFAWYTWTSLCMFHVHKVSQLNNVELKTILINFYFLYIQLVTLTWHLSVCLFVSRPVCPATCMSHALSVHLSRLLSRVASVHLSICPSVHLSCMSHVLSVHLSCVSHVLSVLHVSRPVRLSRRWAVASVSRRTVRSATVPSACCCARCARTRSWGACARAASTTPTTSTWWTLSAAPPATPNASPSSSVPPLRSAAPPPHPRPLHPPPTTHSVPESRSTARTWYPIDYYSITSRLLPWSIPHRVILLYFGNFSVRCLFYIAIKVCSTIDLSARSFVVFTDLVVFR